MNFLLLFFLFIFSCGAEENFLLIHGSSGEVILQMGPHVNERVTPCSTFKIALSLMGYDSEILKDAKNPTWDFQEGFDDYLLSWKAPQTPESWMRNSCVWYSRILASQLGSERFQHYLSSFDYGNQDMSGGLTKAWLSSSLKISPKEQVDFIQKILNGNLPISSSAIQKTKGLLFQREMSQGWKLFGKTGMGSIIQEGKTLELGWFIGWIEKDRDFFPFAYNIREIKIDPARRIQRIKRLIEESNMMNEDLMRIQSNMKSSM